MTLKCWIKFNSNKKNYGLFKCRLVTKYIFLLYILLFSAVSVNVSYAQVGIGFDGNGAYEGVIGYNKGAVTPYNCPAGTVMRGIYHVDKSMTAYLNNVKGMTSQVGIYCGSISIDANDNVGIANTTPNGTPTVLGASYNDPGTTREGYCPAGSVITRLGGYDRTSQGNTPWSSSLEMSCEPVGLGTADWVEFSGISSAPLLVGVNEDNYPHVKRGPFCASGGKYTAVTGIFRQAGGEGYDGINVYCGLLQQARHSSYFTFENYAWNKTLGGTGWLVNLTQNNVLLNGAAGTGANKVPYASATANDTADYLKESELFVLPASGYGASISQRPANSDTRSYTVSGSCGTGQSRVNLQDLSCELKVTGRPDIAVDIFTPEDTYDMIGQSKNVIITATNIGPGVIGSNFGYALEATIPAGWGVGTLPAACTSSGQILTCQINQELAASTANGTNGGKITFTVPFITAPDVLSGTFPVPLKLLRTIPDQSGNQSRIDYNTSNDQDTDLIGYSTLPAITLIKISKGGTGSFTFTGDNGWQNETITTTIEDYRTIGVIQNPTNVGTPITITESVPRSWKMTDVSCTGLAQGGSVSVDYGNNRFTLNGAATTYESDILCDVTNQFIAIDTRKSSDIGNGISVKKDDVITYSLTTNIKGGAALEDIVLTDVLSAGLEFVEIVDAGGFITNTSADPLLLFTLPGGTAEGQYTVTYRAKVIEDATTAVSNSVEPNIGECFDCVTTNPVIKVSSEKSVDVGTGQAVQQGDTLTYTLTTIVEGGATPDDIVLTDTLGDGLKLAVVVSSSAFIADVSGDPILTFTLPANTPAGTYSVVYQAIVLQDAQTSVSNRVTADTGECENCETINPIVGIFINKTSDIGSGSAVQVGDFINYTLAVEITDGNTTQPLILTDVLGEGLTFVEVTDVGEFQANTAGAPTLIFTLPTGAAPGTYPVSYRAQVTSGNVVSVNNTVTPSDGDCNVCQTENPLVGISTTKAANFLDGAAVQAGDTITYTLTVSVTGGVATTQPTVLTDDLSAGLTFVQGSVSGPDFVADTTGAPRLVFTLPAGAQAGDHVVTYQATVDEDVTVTAVNNGVVSDVGICDDCAVTNPILTAETNKQSDVGNGTSVQTGDIITYTLTTVITSDQAANNGVTTKDIVLTDTLGDGLTYVPNSAQGDFIPNTSDAPVLKFTLLAGTPAGTYDVTYRASVDSDATVQVANQVTSDTGSCIDCEIINPISNVSTLKSSDIGAGTAVQINDEITYSLTVTVEGGATSKPVVLTDTLGAGLTYVAGSATGADFTNNVSGAPVLVFTLPAGAAVGDHVVSYKASVNDTATVQVSNTVVPDTGPCDTCEIINPISNVSTIKSSDVGAGTAVDINDEITYTLTVTVEGGATSQPVVLTDTLGTGLTYVAGSATSADFTNNVSGAPVLVFTLPAGAAVGDHLVSYKASVNDTATVQVSNAVVPDTGPCDTCEIINPLASDIQITKGLVQKSSGEQDIVKPGEILTYEINLVNTGGDEPGFGLQDIMDPNTIFVSATNNGTHSGALQGGVVEWSGLVIPGKRDGVNGELTVTVVVRVVDPIPATVTEIKNIAKETGEPDPECPSDQCVTNPVQIIKITLVKTGVFDAPEGSVPAVNDTITYTFKVTNESNVTVSDVTILDQGPTFDGTAATGNLSSVQPASATLAPAGTETFTATYTLTQEDIDNGAGIDNGVKNLAKAQGDVTGPSTGTTQVESNEDEAVLGLPANTTDITVIKVSDLQFIRRGEQAPFTIRVINNSSQKAKGVRIVDTIPVGFRYIDGTGTVDGEKRDPIIKGRALIFEDVDVPANGQTIIRVRLLALSTAGPGKHTNVAIATDPSGDPISNESRADVEILAEPVFDCGDVIGTVFDDRNRNGYQDDGEPGLPGVRVATVKGWLVTTDKYGRFHVPCASLPDQRIGSNFIMKLDNRTLPTGYRVTTENPRVVRLTAGKMTSLNFGAAIGRVVRLDLQADAFKSGSTELKSEWSANLKQLITVLRTEVSILRLSYNGSASENDLAKKRLKLLRQEISSLWKKDGAPYRLDVETRIEAAK